MKRKTVIFSIFSIIAVIALIYYGTSTPSEDAWSAMNDLKQQEYYGFGYQVATGEPIESTQLFINILKSPKSHVVFRTLYDEGDEVAKAYAIAGLHQSFIGSFDSRIDDFRDLGITIPVVFHNPMTPPDVIEEIMSDVFKNNIQPHQPHN